MLLFSRICVRICCKKLFTDDLGNEFFISKKREPLSGKFFRYVIFSKQNKDFDTALISPYGFIWLHYLTDDIPL